MDDLAKERGHIIINDVRLVAQFVLGGEDDLPTSLPSSIRLIINAFTLFFQLIGGFFSHRMSQTKLEPAPLSLPFFAVTIFMGAFLLFFVQPLIGKYILPWFGGAPNVWTTCLLFFQSLLLVGYAYAHLVNRFLPLRKQVIVHGVLLLLATITLPITPSESLKPTGNELPTVQILLVLTQSIGLPYLVLSTTSPLVQAWFAKAHPGRSPYRLYALSNVGSLLALLGFPFLVEPWMTRTAQINWWSLGMVFYVLVCGYLAWSLRSVPNLDKDEAKKEKARLGENESRLRRLAILGFWLALPACGTAILMGTTNKLCQDMAVVPFLWMLPLALYLVTFIISFHGSRWYIREVYIPLLVLLWAGVLWVMFKGVVVHIIGQILVFCGALFLSCMICHGELYRLRPEPARLTMYYLTISAGGALGGLFVALLAPMLFHGYWEYHISLWAVGLLVLMVQGLNPEDLTAVKWRGLSLLRSYSGSLAICSKYFKIIISSTLIAQVLTVLVSLWAMEEMVDFTIGVNISEWLKISDLPGEQWIRLLLIAVAVTLPLNCIFWFSTKHQEDWGLRCAGYLLVLVPALGILGVGLTIQGIKTQQDAVHLDRNFYGTLMITRYFDDSDEPYLALWSGRITHGIQYEALEICNRTTTYYTPESGVGLSMQHTQADRKRVGVIGLGVGTVAGYAQAGESYRFYDINPQVVNLSSEEQSQFTFLIDAQIRGAEVEIVLGDARLSMEQELNKGDKQNFDLLVLDAFSSDSIPVHLLTKESMGLYREHTHPEGVIAIHVSNKYLDLETVVRRLATEMNMMMVVVDSDNGESLGEDWIYDCTWILLSDNEEFIRQIEGSGYPRTKLSSQEDSPLWTDEYTSIFRIFYKPEWWTRWFESDPLNQSSL